MASAASIVGPRALDLGFRAQFRPWGFAKLLLMDKILHDPKDPKLWELWYIPYNG